MKPKTDNDYEGYTCIGQISTPHGVRGDVRIYPQTDTPEYYVDQSSFFVEIDNKLEVAQVERSRMHKGFLCVKLDLFEDRTAVESYRSCRVFLPDDELRPLDEGEYFIHQLVGCQVQSTQGDVIGDVKDVFETGANSVYVIQSEKDQKEILIPSSPDVIVSVDISKKQILIDVIEGLLD